MARGLTSIAVVTVCLVGAVANVAMHKGWSLQCHFLVLKSGPPFLTVVERGRFQTSIIIDLYNTEY